MEIAHPLIRSLSPLLTPGALAYGLHRLNWYGAPMLFGMGLGSCVAQLIMNSSLRERLKTTCLFIDNRLKKTPSILRIIAVASIILERFSPFLSAAIGFSIGLTSGLRLDLHRRQRKLVIALSQFKAVK